MINLQYIEPILKMWELALISNSPIFVKNIHLSLKYKDVIKYTDYTILMGIVYAVITMEDRQFSIDWKGVTESYNNSESKEVAEKIIIITLKKHLTDEFEKKKYKDFWNRIDFDNEDWKRKEE